MLPQLDSANFSEVLSDIPATKVMQPNPLTVRSDWYLKQAASFLISHRIAAAPVVDADGAITGVLSISDIVRGCCVNELAAEKFEHPELIKAALEDPSWIVLRCEQETFVRDIMSSSVISVRPTTPLSEIIRTLLKHDIHRLFVSDARGILIGVITPFDILRCMV